MSDKLNEKDINALGDDGREEQVIPPALEKNDNWEFEATAHTLENTVIENDEMTIEIPGKNSETAVEEPAVAAPAQKTKTVKFVDNAKSQLAFKKFLTAMFSVVFIALIALITTYYFSVPNTKEMMNAANVAMTVGKEKVSIGMYNYFYNATVESYLQAAAQGSVELDPENDYSKQVTTDEDGKEITWEKRFKKETKEQIQQLLAYYSAAVEDGVSLTEEQRKSVEEDMKSVRKAAEDADFENADKYTSTTYGEYCGVATLQKMEEWSYVAREYLRKQAIELRPEEEKVREYFNKNKDDFVQAPVAYLFVPFTNETKEAKVKEAQGYAKQIKNKNDMKKLIPVVFKEMIDSYVEQGYYASAEKAAVEIASEIETKVNKTETRLPSSAMEWLFDENIKVGACQAFVSDEAQTIYILLKTDDLTLADEPLYSVRHILIMPEDKNIKKESDTDQSAVVKMEEATEEQRAEAEKKINKIYEDFKNGDRSEYSFAQLAEETSMDTASLSKGGNGNWGGLYGNEPLGQMVAEFEEWATNDARKYGDTAIVKTEFGYHLMYFIENVPSYYTECESVLISKKQKDFMKSYKVKERLGMKKVKLAQPKKAASSVENDSAAE